MNQPRHPAGAPVGGRFAPDRVGRAPVSLGEDEPASDSLGFTPPALTEEQVPAEVEAAIRAEAAEMPYGLGSRYVEARMSEERGRVQAESIRAVLGLGPLAPGRTRLEAHSGASLPVGGPQRSDLPTAEVPEPDADSGADPGTDDTDAANVTGPGRDVPDLAAGSAAALDAADSPVPADHPDFQAGGLTPRRIFTGDGTCYRRIDDSTVIDQPYSFLFVADRPMTEHEIGHFAQLAGYTYRSTVYGEPMDDPERIAPHAFVISADTTKGRGNPEDFVRQLPAILTTGSPLRMTDRSGPGSKGTRLVDAMTDPPTFAIYADDVLD